MYAGVGAAGADERDRLVGYAAERRLDRHLDRGRAALFLPAAEGRPVVLDADGDAAHGRSGISRAGNR
jgi:hypothetical protein